MLLLFLKVVKEMLSSLVMYRKTLALLKIMSCPLFLPFICPFILTKMPLFWPLISWVLPLFEMWQLCSCH